MIILDELPTRSLLDEEEHDRPARFPNLAAFADDATWYRHHTRARRRRPTAAVPSLLTGDAPDHRRRRSATNHPDNLFTLLAPTHELEVLESATELCPYDVCVPTAHRADDRRGCSTATGPGTARPPRRDRVDLWFDRVSLGPTTPPASSTTSRRSSRPARPRRRRAPGTVDPRSGPTTTCAVIVARSAARDHRVVRRRQGPGPLLPAPDAPPPAVALPRRTASCTRSRPVGLDAPGADRPSPVLLEPVGRRGAASSDTSCSSQYADQIVGQLMDGLATRASTTTRS